MGNDITDNVAKTHVAQAAGIDRDEVQHTEPCECCGLHMQYAVTEDGAFFHPWGGPVDELHDVVTIRCRHEADHLLEHLAQGPPNRMDEAVERILDERFPRHPGTLH